MELSIHKHKTIKLPKHLKVPVENLANIMLYTEVSHSSYYKLLYNMIDIENQINVCFDKAIRKALRLSKLAWCSRTVKTVIL